MNVKVSRLEFHSFVVKTGVRGETATRPLNTSGQVYSFDFLDYVTGWDALCRVMSVIEVSQLILYLFLFQVKVYK